MGSSSNNLAGENGRRLPPPLTAASLSPLRVSSRPLPLSSLFPLSASGQDISFGPSVVTFPLHFACLLWQRLLSRRRKESVVRGDCCLQAAARRAARRALLRVLRHVERQGQEEEEEGSLLLVALLTRTPCLLPFLVASVACYESVATA